VWKPSSQENAVRYPSLLLLCLTLLSCRSGGDASAPSPATSSEAPSNYSTEATVNLRRLYEAAYSYFQTERVSPTGDFLPPQFPQSTQRTPRQIPCGRGVTPEAHWWTTPTWEALDFAVVDAMHYAYQFDSSGTGGSAVFTAWAFGDLDCDRVASTFSHSGSVDSEGNVVGAGNTNMTNPNE
jgi:hypothetical protein